MIPAAIIGKTRDGIPLQDEEIRTFIKEYTTGAIQDYQMSAWAMAVLCRGLTMPEIRCFTSAMLDSGDVLRPVSDRPRVDKHSTGGLGDKVSLILAPLLALFDLDVPMISGRGLGITGGTLDKLEAIEGFRTNLSVEEVANQIRSIGCVITGASQNLVPADRKLYALRDVTGTVPAIPLITSSIMSKKLAESLDALVLDVKWGSAAFMQEKALARKLAETLMSIGNQFGVPTQALLTDMNQPLGEMIGNACEVNESIDVLQGGGPASTRELTLELAVPLLRDTLKMPEVEARTQLAAALDEGQAYERFADMVRHQHGKLESKLSLETSHDITSAKAGFVHWMDGQLIGQCIIELGGGRKFTGDAINHRVGIQILKRLGDPIDKGELIARMFCSAAAFDLVRPMFESALTIDDAAVKDVPKLWEPIELG